MMIIFYLTNVKKYCAAWDKKTIVQKKIILRDILATFFSAKKNKFFSCHKTSAGKCLQNNSGKGHNPYFVSPKL
jgi:hypothetical protein